jgi:hypothetical protein
MEEVTAFGKAAPGDGPKERGKAELKLAFPSQRMNPIHFFEHVRHPS